MRLRDHPALTISGIPSWPPVWVRRRTKATRKVYGELGVFTGSVFNESMPTAIFMKMEFKAREYMGFLSVGDAVFCLQLDRLLNQNIGRSIEEIGDIDISVLL